MNMMEVAVGVAAVVYVIQAVAAATQNLQSQMTFIFQTPVSPQKPTILKTQ